MLVQTVFMKFIMCTIYGTICKQPKNISGKKFLNVTTVKKFTNKKMGFFDVFLFQPLIQGKCIPILWFVTFHCLEIAPKIHNHSKFRKEQEMFANWVVDGTHYAFHEN